MAVVTAAKEMRKYLGNLDSSSTPCVAFGGSFVAGKNLFMPVEPSEATQCITVIPYGGGYPSNKNRQESYVQIRVRTKKNKSCIETSQALINKLHRNGNICASNNGIVYANQSAPAFLPSIEGGEYKISVVDYTIKHVQF